MLLCFGSVWDRCVAKPASTVQQCTWLCCLSLEFTLLSSCVVFGRSDSKADSLDGKAFGPGAAAAAEDDKVTASGAVGEPKERNIMWTKCVFILVSEFCERMAYYGFQGMLLSKWALSF